MREVIMLIPLIFIVAILIKIALDEWHTKSQLERLDKEKLEATKRLKEKTEVKERMTGRKYNYHKAVFEEVEPCDK